MAKTTKAQKAEQFAAGRHSGAEQFTRALSQFAGRMTELIRGGEAASVRAEAGLQASVWMSLTNMQNCSDFFDGFVGAFSDAVMRAHSELPDVKRAAAERSMRRRIQNALESAAHELAHFAERLSQNPLYAFEWSDDAFKAAAEQDVALTLQKFLDGGEDVAPAFVGYEPAIAYARRMALQGARSPKHSTSQPSNLCEQYKTAAFATYADAAEGRDY